jgi:hypothetical protein
VEVVVANPLRARSARNATTGKPTAQNEVLAHWFLCRHFDAARRKSPAHQGKQSGAKWVMMLTLPGLPTCARTQRGRTETGSRHSANPPTQHRAV